MTLKIFGVFLFVASLFVMAISFFVFSRIIVKRIDKEMAKDGLPKSFPVDLMGTRVVSIAVTIITPKRFLPKQDFLFEVGAKELYPYAKRADKICAAIMHGSFICMMLSGALF